MSLITSYGDISPRTAAYAIKDMLKRGMPYLCLEKFGQTYPLPPVLPLPTAPLVLPTRPTTSRWLPRRLLKV